MTTNLWKPIALVAIACCVGSMGMQVASAAGVCRDQGNMQAALDHLEGALMSLERAEHNKGGWRVRAIKAAQVAREETKAGCAYADGK